MLMIDLIGYVASLLLLLSSVGGLWAIHALRGAAEVFVAAVVPIVPALVAAHTPKGLRAPLRVAGGGIAARLLAGTMLDCRNQWPGSAGEQRYWASPLSTRIGIVISAVLGVRRLVNQGLGVALPAMSAMRDTKALVSSLE